MKNLWQSICDNWEASGLFTCDTENIYILTSESSLSILSAGSSEVHHLDLAIADVINMTYLQLEEKLIFITKTSIISYSPLNKECINEGEMNCQILSAKWSPNQETLIMSLSNGALFVQNADLEVVKVQQIPIKDSSSIAWRNDSKFFQVCGKCEGGLLVFTFDSKGEPSVQNVVSDKAGPVVSLYDRGDILTSTEISWHSSLVAGISNNTVVLWEKNCLKHEEFTVYGSQALKVEWSLDGKILGVLSDKGLELYVKDNYKWYLKILLNDVKAFGWAEEFLVYLDKSLWKVEVKFKFDVDKDAVAVVDGVKVYVTEFSKGILPPPLSHFCYDLQKPSKFLSFHNKEICVIGDGIVEYPTGKEVHNGSADLVIKIAEELFFTVKETVFKSNSEVVFKYQHLIVKLINYCEELYVLLKDGSLYKNSTRVCKFPKACDEVFLMQICEKTEAIGLINGNLYINDKLFTNSCTSVLVSGGFLFFIKKNAPFDVLFIFHHSDLPWNKTLPEPSSDHFYSRNVEKTSSLVCLSGCNLVLQHSRGNLETICPRLLILHQAKQMVLNKEYLQVFKLLRQHKIDLNLIYDIEPSSFSVSSFLKQVTRTEFINLFLTSLKDFDSVSKYFHTQPRDFEGKTNKISEMLIKELNPDSHSLCILTAFVVKVPAEIEEALKWVQNLKSKLPPKPLRPPHEAAFDTHTKTYVEDAIKYLSWLVNPEKLYNVALGMYDLELTSDLAKYTQKDPKEYLPYLNNLKQMHPVLMKYNINIDLKNYNKALEELVVGGPDFRPQCIDLIKSQKLFRKGLELLTGDDVYLALAESLAKLDHPLQAAALFEASGAYTKAKDLYVQCEEWELALKMSEYLHENNNELWSSKCAELGRFESAATLLLPNDEENLKIKYWIQAGKYKKAATICRTPEGKNLLKSTLKNYSNDMISDLNKNLKTWIEKKARLDIVQQNKKLMPESSKVMNDETASLYSLDSSMSKVTQFTKKQRKKNKKIRKTAAKEGSVYEEDYLVDLLVTLRPDAVYMEKVENLCIGLIIVGEFLQAYQLWKTMEDVKSVTFVQVGSLGQMEFLKKFYEGFPEIGKSEENDSRLKDMYAKSTFLAEGLGSHKLPGFSSKLQSFFKSLV